mmetsp:Transcript_51318/g.128783  ORF Transcript_51318/g.128783 Transcript_51318/m.128783 type:complete len:217 (-) Transcript_51318:1082-1732(-)
MQHHSKQSPHKQYEVLDQKPERISGTHSARTTDLFAEADPDQRTHPTTAEYHHLPAPSLTWSGFGEMTLSQDPDPDPGLRRGSPHHRCVHRRHLPPADREIASVFSTSPTAERRYEGETPARAGHRARSCSPTRAGSEDAVRADSNCSDRGCRAGYAVVQSPHCARTRRRACPRSRCTRQSAASRALPRSYCRTAATNRRAGLHDRQRQKQRQKQR